MILLTIFNAPFAAAIMPKSYLDLQAPSDVSVDNWLTWPVLKLESSISDENSKIAGFMGINKAGDLQYIFIPTVVPNALGNATVLLHNSTDVRSEPSLIFVDTSDLRFTSVIETFTKIPDNICPEEYLPSKFIKGMSWENAKVPLGLAHFPIFALIFFGLCAVKTSVHDTDFEDKVGSFSISTKHLHWGKLIKMHVQQQKNDEKDFDKIFDRIFSGCKETNSKFVTPGSFGHDFVCIPFIQLFTLRRNRRITKPCFVPFSKVTFVSLGPPRVLPLPLLLLLPTLMPLHPLLPRKIIKHLMP